jgi:hypothetical protein
MFSKQSKPCIKMYFKRCFHGNRPKYFIYKFTFTSLQLALVICIEMVMLLEYLAVLRSRSRKEPNHFGAAGAVLNILNNFCYSYLTMTRNQEKRMLDLNCMVTFIPLNIFGLL